jgi:predicted phage terminase large subunit-like protein
MVYDDVVTRDSVQSDGMMSKIEDTFALSKNLGSDQFTTRILGTRYHFGDLYGKLIKQAETGEIDLMVRVRPVVEDWPDCERVHLWTVEDLRTKAAEMGSSVFSAQVLCTPMDPEHAPFKAEHMKFYTSLPDGWQDWPKYLLVDPAGWDETGTAKGGDHAAFVVVGTDELNRWYVLDLERSRMAPKGIIDLIFRLDEKWKLRTIGIEKEKYGKTLKYWLDAQMRDRGWPLHIEEVKFGGANNRSKEDKIMGLQAMYEAGHILIRPDMTALIEEFRHYGYWDSDDCIDALSSGLQVIPRRKEPAKHRREQRPTARNRWGAW